MNTHIKSFPNDSPEYVSARGQLLEAEHNLVQEIERIAELRRALPLGGAIPTDYRFELARPGAEPEPTTFLRLFRHPTIMLYSFMFDGSAPVCPMCTSLIDGFNGMAPDIAELIDFYIVAPAAIGDLRDYAATRNWRNLNLLADLDSQFSTDYGGISEDGELRTKMTVFTQAQDGTAHHFYSTADGDPAPGQDDRHLDLLWPLWGALDLTPAGRRDWRPSRQPRR